MSLSELLTIVKRRYHLLPPFSVNANALTA